MFSSDPESRWERIFDAFEAFTKSYLKVAIACLAATIVVFAFVVYQLVVHNCGKSQELVYAGAGVFVSGWCLAFFAFSVTDRGKSQLRRAAQSELGAFPIITYPFKIYVLEVILAVFLFTCFSLSLLAPVGAYLLTENTLRECSLI